MLHFRAFLHLPEANGRGAAVSGLPERPRERVEIVGKFPAGTVWESARNLHSPDMFSSRSPNTAVTYNEPLGKRYVVV
ncbi:hypothetical protein ZHAS_00004189 [Anopheles sinensis]|uniref:Uncharacterized protein n=1 Tax=Anopheles sinensis TaxID=74873 RepID=A0A084VG97_ANOSI|nr:hypothetical protein ZHAS_00004189 [Anopheles sinensis]